MIPANMPNHSLAYTSPIPTLTPTPSPTSASIPTPNPNRVVIFVALFLFTQGETFPLPKIVGCAIAIAGCMGFAIFDSKKM